jgi:Fe-S-cluster containining protein
MSNPTLPDIEITAENKCGFCNGAKCCTYFTQKVETPRSKYDFEHLLWQISHANTQVYQDEDGWYLMFRSICTHLQNDGRCGIYDTRPEICRAYDNDYCEYDEPPEKNFKRFFADYDALHTYCKKRFRKWER